MRIAGESVGFRCLFALRAWQGVLVSDSAALSDASQEGGTKGEGDVGAVHHRCASRRRWLVVSASLQRSAVANRRGFGGFPDAGSAKSAQRRVFAVSRAFIRFLCAPPTEVRESAWWRCPATMRSRSMTKRRCWSPTTRSSRASAPITRRYVYDAARVRGVSRALAAGADGAHSLAGCRRPSGRCWCG